MLIATVGHIDHGKTALVRALTGADTDRLPEEKARGMSIDLGFAYWRPDEGEPVGFVDVPGHERFVRNMLAGLGGVDFALLAVAADDGVMPQTVEHVRILDLLGIARGCVALTKCDRADVARLAEVRGQIGRLLSPTGLAAIPVFDTSTVTGAGIGELAAALREEARRETREAHGQPRLAIDRCFTVTGAGTVVTGTLLAGSLAMGDQLVLAPRGLPARVRGLQCAGQAVGRARAGQRCAVNLAGVEVSEVHRGDWLVHPALQAATTRIEARVRVLEGREAPLRHGALLRLYIGAAEIPARMLSRRQSPIAPGAEAVIDLALDRPSCATNGMRFVLRDGSGRELVGGGRVIDPFPPARRRREESGVAVTAALERHDASASLAALLAIAGLEVDCLWFERCFGLSPEQARELYAAAGAQVLGKERPVVVARARAEALGDEVLRLLAGWHRDRPAEGGMTVRDIRSQLSGPLSAEALAAILRQLAGRQAIAFAGSLARLPGHAPLFAPAEAAMWQAMLDWLEDCPPRTVTPAEAASELRTGEAAARAMLHRRRIAGDVWAIDQHRFMLRDHVAMLAASAEVLAGRHPEGFTAAQFRDATGIGRNHVIRLLEFLDRIGVTARRGEGRIVRPGHASVTGEARPWLAGEGGDHAG